MVRSLGVVAPKAVACASVALLAVALCAVPGVAATRHHRAARRHHHRRAYNGYSSSVSPGITCRYPDGTPYDPDIIGGANHVGAGGPAVNFGGFDPCAY